MVQSEWELVILLKLNSVGHGTETTRRDGGREGRRGRDCVVGCCKDVASTCVLRPRLRTGVLISERRLREVDGERERDEK